MREDKLHTSIKPVGVSSTLADSKTEGLPIFVHKMLTGCLWGPRGPGARVNHTASLSAHISRVLARYSRLKPLAHRSTLRSILHVISFDLQKNKVIKFNHTHTHAYTQTYICMHTCAIFLHKMYIILFIQYMYVHTYRNIHIHTRNCLGKGHIHKRDHQEEQDLRCDLKLQSTCKISFSLGGRQLCFL